MAKVDIPTKQPGDPLTNEEVNNWVIANNDTDDEAKKRTHSFNDVQFMENGTVTIGGDVIPVIWINPAMFNPAHFTVTNGVVSLTNP